MRLSFAAAFTLALVVAPACSSGSSPEPPADASADGAGGGGDGKYHPAANGVPMTEADACNALSMAQDAAHTALGCPSTSRPCPALLRAQFTTPCLQYDQGTVQGCVAYYGMATTCSDLAMAIDDCVVAPIDGSAPAGCP